MRQEIKIEDVRQVYRGKHGCCCGCRGKHSYPSHNIAEGGAENVDDAEVQKIIRYMNKKIATVPFNIESSREGLEDGGDYIAFGTKTRLTIVYLKK